MNGFMSAMKSTLNDEFNVSVTENGAVGYRTTGKELLDLNFAVASLRKASPNDIANLRGPENAEKAHDRPQDSSGQARPAPCGCGRAWNSRRLRDRRQS